MLVPFIRLKYAHQSLIHRGFIHDSNACELCSVQASHNSISQSHSTELNSVCESAEWKHPVYFRKICVCTALARVLVKRICPGKHLCSVCMSCLTFTHVFHIAHRVIVAPSLWSTKVCGTVWHDSAKHNLYTDARTTF